MNGRPAKQRTIGANPQPLLCELHAHTTWSDGELSVRQLVDLYGHAGFDVLAITDHVFRRDDASLYDEPERPCIDASNYDDYLAAVEAEAERARDVFDLLVVPGLELTYDHRDPAIGAHAVAVGLRAFVDVDQGIDGAIVAAAERGAALIAAHPYSFDAVQGAARTTGRFALERDWAASVLHRFELVNRHDFFGWVAEAKLPVVANGDFHQLEHLSTWKTLLPCAKDEDAVVEYLRSGREALLTRVAAPRLQLAA
jgi:PHP domain